MELLLNALWLLTAAGVITFWYREPGRVRVARRPIQALLCQFVALGCALILLFPVISVSDDLHAQQAVIEDSTRLTLKARRASQGCLGVGQSFEPAVRSLAFPSLGRVIVGQVSPLEVRVRRFFLLFPSQGRSPPLQAN